MSVGDDRNALLELMALWATMLDTKDWDLASSVFAEPVSWDFRSAGLDIEQLSVADLSARLELGFIGFSATDHAITNHRIIVNGDRAHIRAHIHAQHWVRPDLADAEEGDCWDVYGFYDDNAIRTVDGWRLNGVKLTLTRQTGQRVGLAALEEGQRLASS